MIKIILSMAVAMLFSGCVGIGDPITTSHTMEIKYPKQQGQQHIVKDINNIPKSAKRAKVVRKINKK